VIARLLDNFPTCLLILLHSDKENIIVCTLTDQSLIFRRYIFQLTLDNQVSCYLFDSTYDLT